jgi:hypothetical protein
MLAPDLPRSAGRWRCESRISHGLGGPRTAQILGKRHGVRPAAAPVTMADTRANRALLRTGRGLDRELRSPHELARPGCRPPRPATMKVSFTAVRRTHISCIDPDNLTSRIMKDGPERNYRDAAIRSPVPTKPGRHPVSLRRSIATASADMPSEMTRPPSRRIPRGHRPATMSRSWLTTMSVRPSAVSSRMRARHLR